MKLHINKAAMFCKRVKLMFLLLLPFMTKAQSAVVDVARIRASATSLTKADSMIAAEKLRYQKQYMAIEQAFIKHRQLADSLEKLPTAASHSKRINALRDSMQLELKTAENFMQEASQKIQAYEQSTLAPEFERLKTGIQQVAKRKGLQTVSEKSNLLYWDPKADISEDVILELNHSLKTGLKK